MSVVFRTINNDPDADIGISVAGVYRGMISTYLGRKSGTVLLDLLGHRASRHASIELAKKRAITLLVAMRLEQS